jgi:hypothetical protein
MGRGRSPLPQYREVTLAEARLPSPDARFRVRSPLSRRRSRGLRIRGSVAWLSPRRAPHPPRFLAPERGRPQSNVPLTPFVVCSWSHRLKRPAFPVTEIDRVALRTSRNEASCARDPFTSPPGFGAEAPDPASLLSRSSPPEGPACAGPPAEGRFERSSAKKSAVGCTQGAFHRGTTNRSLRRLRAALPARATASTGRLGVSPQVVPNLWICACAFSSSGGSLCPDGAKRTPRLDRPPTSFS